MFTPVVFFTVMYSWVCSIDIQGFKGLVSTVLLAPPFEPFLLGGREMVFTASTDTFSVILILRYGDMECSGFADRAFFS